MRRLHRLSLVTLGVTYLLVTAGGFVRATGSGLGCPDWPRCHGQVVPPGDYHALIEFSHRAIASVVIVLTAALAVTAFRARHALSPAAVRLALATVPLVLVQALLGAVVVLLELHAESVVAHLLLAMTLLCLLISLAIETAPATATPVSPGGAGGPRPRPGIDAGYARLVAGVAAATLALMLLGSYVSGRGAGLAFTDWPLFDGRLVPDRSGLLPHLHFAHRVLAGIVAVAVIAAALLVRSRPQAPAVTRLVRLAAAAIVVQILVGAGNIWTRLSAPTRTAHLALGAFVFAVLFAAARLAWRLPSPGPAGSGPAPPPEPAPTYARAGGNP